MHDLLVAAAVRWVFGLVSTAIIILYDFSGNFIIGLNFKHDFQNTRNICSLCAEKRAFIFLIGAAGNF